MSLTKVIPSMFETPLSGVLGGSGLVSHPNSFVIGVGLSSAAVNTLFVDNISEIGRAHV